MISLITHKIEQTFKKYFLLLNCSFNDKAGIFLPRVVYHMYIHIF